MINQNIYIRTSYNDILVLIYGEFLKNKIKKNIKIDGWYTENRNILHFDSPISYKNANTFVKNSTFVQRHSFFPFLTFNLKFYKYKKDSTTNEMIRYQKDRSICYSAHLDNCIYSYYSKNLSEKYESMIKKDNFSNSILAFRKIDKKNNVAFAKQAFDDIKIFGECNVFAIDFSDFFGTLDHSLLKDKWYKVLNVPRLPSDHYNIFKSLTKYSLVNKDKIYDLFKISKNNPKNRPKRICNINDFRNKVRKENYIKQNPKINDKIGIPQGSSLSALLSNIYLIDFDKDISEYVEKISGKYYRYCDDILIITPLNECNNTKDFVYNMIKKEKLIINPEKTKISLFQLNGNKLSSLKPLQYLGFIFDGENIYIRSSSISNFYRRMKKGVKLAKSSMIKFNKIHSKNGQEERLLFKKKLYERYSFLGGSNFIKYGLYANKTMESNKIKKQLSRLWKRLNDEIAI